MSDERFSLDTNILIYALDAAAGAKHLLAAEILDRSIDRDCRLTLQSLSEFYVAATRKGIVPRSEAAAQVEDWLLLFPSLAASPTSIRTALAGAASGRTSYWDGLLIATAAEGGCTALISEDMANGAIHAAVRIVNPFAGTKLSEPAAKLLSV